MENNEAIIEKQEAFEEDRERVVFHKFMDVKHIMRALHHCKKAQGGPGSDPMRGRGRILALLKLKDGVATKDMAQILGIRVSSLNETLAKLEKDGLVVRTPAEDDKRVMLVSLTEDGRAQAQPAGRFPARMFEGFSDDDLAAFEAYLDRITANLEAGLGEDEKEYLENMRKARNDFMHGHGCCHGHGPHGGHGGPHGHCHGKGHGEDHGEGEGHGPHGHGGGCGHGGHGPHHHHHPHGFGYGHGGCCHHHGPHGHGGHCGHPHHGHHGYGHCCH